MNRNWESWVIIILMFIVVGLGLFAFNGGLSSEGVTKATANNVFASVLAALLCLLAFGQLPGRQAKQSANFARQIAELLDANRALVHFDKIGRNGDFEGRFWQELIYVLDTAPEPAWFLGNRLTEWRDTPTYSKLLEEKLRIRMATSMKHKGHYRTYILVGDSEAAEAWQRFADRLVAEIQSRRSAQDYDDVVKHFSKNLVVRKLDTATLHYAATLCGKRLVVVNYVGASLSGDNPTFDIRPESPIWHLYHDDLKRIGEKVEKRGAGPEPSSAHS